MQKLFVFLNVILMSAILIGCSSKSSAQVVDPTPAIIKVVTSTSLPVNAPTDTPAIPTVLPAPTFIEEPRPSLPDSDVALSINTRSLIALRAATLAVESMPGPYSWNEYRSCSTYASAYLKVLSFPVSDHYGKYADLADPLPFSGVLNQLDWFNRNYPQYVTSAPLNDFLEGKLWNNINPGDLIYLQTAIGHNGYNTYYHVVVYMGQKEDGTRQFAEIAAGMKNASVNRTFQQMTSFYKQRADGTWATEGYNLGNGNPAPTLLVTIVDPLAILNQGKLWRKDGIVTPNAPLFNDYDEVVTINIEDGTLVIFNKVENSWSPVFINGRSEFYSVVGRRLPANNSITQTFFDNRPEVYDGDYGVYISTNGIYQDTWTPQFISHLVGFERLSDFGGIGGSTDTSLLKQITTNKKGNISEGKYNSSFTFHLIPNVTNQDMLLREDLLTLANNPQSPLYGSVKDLAKKAISLDQNHTIFNEKNKPTVYLSSGCINFDQPTWEIIKNYLQSQLELGKKIAVVFSYPHFDQNLLLGVDIYKSPFTGQVFDKWCPQKDKNPCDYLDRRTYRYTYLGDKYGENYE